jgi:hypothetical protein
MKKVKTKDINVTRHTADGFTLSYLTYDGNYYRKRYIGYSVNEAKRQFKLYVCKEDGKQPKHTGNNDVPVEALRCICGGSREAARKPVGG